MGLKKCRREKIAEECEATFPELEAAIGGETGIDIYPVGRDKSQIINDLDIQNKINKRKCMRYKSTGDLTLAFLEDPLEVEPGTNIITNGVYEGKAFFASITVYRVIARKYNLNRNLLFENDTGAQTQTRNVAEVIDWIPIINPMGAQ